MEDTAQISEGDQEHLGRNYRLNVQRRRSGTLIMKEVRRPLLALRDLDVCRIDMRHNVSISGR